VLILATQFHFASRELILGISILLGWPAAFQMPAQQALTPQLVPQDMLQSAVALSSSGMQVAIIGGPAIGGMLYTTGATTVYVTCAVLLLVAAMLALLVRYQHQEAHWPPRGRPCWLAFPCLAEKVLLSATSLDLFAVLLGVPQPCCQFMRVTSCIPARSDWGCCDQPRQSVRW